MSPKMIRILVLSVLALASLIFFQNLTPAEMDESINSALKEQKQTEEDLQLNSQSRREERSPASIAIPMNVNEEISGDAASVQTSDPQTR